MAPTEGKVGKKAHKFTCLFAKRVTEEKFAGKRKKLKKIFQRAIKQLPEDQLELQAALLKKLPKYFSTLQKRVFGEEHTEILTEVNSNGAQLKVKKNKRPKDDEAEPKKKKKKLDQDFQDKFSYNLYTNQRKLRRKDQEEKESTETVNCLIGEVISSVDPEELDSLLKNAMIESTDWFQVGEVLCQAITGDQRPMSLKRAMLHFNGLLAEQSPTILQYESKKLKETQGNLKKFLMFFQYKWSRMDEKFTNPSYVDIMAALLSVYADIVVIIGRSSDEDKKEALVRHLIMISSLLVPSDYLYDVMLQQQVELNTQDVNLLLPFWRYAILNRRNLESSQVYTKYMCALNSVLPHLQVDDKKDFLKASLSVMPPSEYLSWLCERDESLLDNTPLTANSPDGAITRFFVEEAETDFTERLLNLLTVEPESLGGAAYDAEEPTSSAVDTPASLFFIDTCADPKQASEVAPKDTEDTDVAGYSFTEADIDRELGLNDKDTESESEEDESGSESEEDEEDLKEVLQVDKENDDDVDDDEEEKAVNGEQELKETVQDNESESEEDGSGSESEEDEEDLKEVMQVDKENDDDVDDDEEEAVNGEQEFKETVQNNEGNSHVEDVAISEDQDLKEISQDKENSDDDDDEEESMNGEQDLEEIVHDSEASGGDDGEKEAVNGKQDLGEIVPDDKENMNDEDEKEEIGDESSEKEKEMGEIIEEKVVTTEKTSVEETVEIIESDEEKVETENGQVKETDGNKEISDEERDGESDVICIVNEEKPDENERMELNDENIEMEALPLTNTKTDCDKETITIESDSKESENEKEDGSEELSIIKEIDISKELEKGSKESDVNLTFTDSPKKRSFVKSPRQRTPNKGPQEGSSSEHSSVEKADVLMIDDVESTTSMEDIKETAKPDRTVEESNSKHLETPSDNDKNLKSSEKAVASVETRLTKLKNIEETKSPADRTRSRSVSESSVNSSLNDTPVNRSLQKSVSPVAKKKLLSPSRASPKVKSKAVADDSSRNDNVSEKADSAVETEKETIPKGQSPRKQGPSTPGLQKSPRSPDKKPQSSKKSKLDSPLKNREEVARISEEPSVTRSARARRSARKSLGHLEINVQEGEEEELTSPRHTRTGKILDVSTPKLSRTPGPAGQTPTTRRRSSIKPSSDLYDFTSDVETPAPLRSERPRKICDKRPLQIKDVEVPKTAQQQPQIAQILEEETRLRRRSRRLSAPIGALEVANTASENQTNDMETPRRKHGKNTSSNPSTPAAVQEDAVKTPRQATPYTAKSTRRRSAMPALTDIEEGTTPKISPKRLLSAERKKPLTRRRSTLLSQMSGSPSTR